MLRPDAVSILREKTRPGLTMKPAGASNRVVTLIVCGVAGCFRLSSDR